MLCDPQAHYPCGTPYHETWRFVDSSKLSDLERCERHFFYRYVVGLIRDYESRHTAWGGAFHVALEVLGIINKDLILPGVDIFHDYQRLLSLDTPIDRASLILLYEYAEAGHVIPLEAFTKAMETLTETIPAERWEEMEEEWYPKTPGRLATAILHYIHNHAKDSALYRPYNWEGNSMEVKMSFDFPLGDDGVLYKGRFDKLIQDKTTNRVLAREHKTGIVWNTWAEQWQFSLQIGAYNTMLRFFLGQGSDSFTTVQVDGTLLRKYKVNTKADSRNPFRHLQYLRVNERRNFDQCMLWWAQVETRLSQLQSYFEALSEAKEGDPMLMTFPMKTGNCHNTFGRRCTYADLCSCSANPLSLLADGTPHGFTRKFWDPDNEGTGVQVSVDSSGQRHLVEEGCGNG